MWTLLSSEWHLHQLVKESNVRNARAPFFLDVGHLKELTLSWVPLKGRITRLSALCSVLSLYFATRHSPLPLRPAAENA